MEETTGDEHSVACPYCRKVIRNLWEFGADLYDAEFNCPYCKKRIKVISVETITEIVLRKLD